MSAFFWVSSYLSVEVFWLADFTESYSAFSMLSLNFKAFWLRTSFDVFMWFASFTMTIFLRFPEFWFSSSFCFWSLLIWAFLSLSPFGLIRYAGGVMHWSCWIFKHILAFSASIYDDGKLKFCSILDWFSAIHTDSGHRTSAYPIISASLKNLRGISSYMAVIPTSLGSTVCGWSRTLEW